MALEQYNFGAGILTGIRTDIAAPTPVILGTLQDISVSGKFNTKELTGQYQDPVAIGKGARKWALKAKYAKIQAKGFNDLFFGGSLTTGQSQQVINEGAPNGIAIPAAVTLVTNAITNSGAVLPFTSTTGVVVGAPVSGTNIAAGSYVLSFVPNTSVTLNTPITGSVASGASIVFGPGLIVANPTVFQQDLGVFNAATGVQMTYVASAPAAGQYTVITATGTYVFSSADAVAGVSVIYSYRYNQTTTGSRMTISNQLMGSTTYFSLNLTNQFAGNGLNMIFYRALTTDFMADFKNEDFTAPELSFSCMADSLGRVFDWSSTL